MRVKFFLDIKYLIVASCFDRVCIFLEASKIFTSYGITPEFSVELQKTLYFVSILLSIPVLNNKDVNFVY